MRHCNASSSERRTRRNRRRTPSTRIGPAVRRRPQPSDKLSPVRDNPRDKAARQAPRRILSVLREYEQVGATTYTLLHETKLPRATLMRHLKRLVAEGFARRPVWGLYVIATDPAAAMLSDPAAVDGIHGWVLSKHGSETDPILRMVAERLRRRSDARPGPRGRWTSVDECWKGRAVSFRVYNTGTINVYVASTRAPISWQDATELAGWIGGILNPLDMDRFWVVQFAIHREYRDWYMKGCRAIQFGEWRNAFRQLYEKKGGIRDEIHAHLRPGVLSLSNAARVLMHESAEAIALRTERTRLRRLEREIELIRLRNEHRSAPSAGQIGGHAGARPPALGSTDRTGYG